MAYKYLLSCVFALVLACDVVTSVAIYKDTDVIKKPHRGDRQFNEFPLYEDDEYSVIRNSKEKSQWESAEWPKQFPSGGGGGRRDSSYESESDDRPYNWYYYNKFITNGRFNHLYNGPHLDSQAGIGNSRNRNGNGPPQILPRPASPTYGRAIKKEPRK